MDDNKTIPEIEAEIVDEFSLFDDWESKYEYIIDLGKKLPVEVRKQFVSLMETWRPRRRLPR